MRSATTCSGKSRGARRCTARRPASTSRHSGWRPGQWLPSWPWRSQACGATGATRRSSSFSPGACPFWLILEGVVTKLVHYALPLYPALAVLAVLGIERAARAGRLYGPASGWALFILLGSCPTVVLALVFAGQDRLWALECGRGRRRRAGPGGLGLARRGGRGTFCSEQRPRRRSAARDDGRGAALPLRLRMAAAPERRAEPRRVAAPRASKP